MCYLNTIMILKNIYKWKQDESNGNRKCKTQIKTDKDNIEQVEIFRGRNSKYQTQENLIT